MTNSTLDFVKINKVLERFAEIDKKASLSYVMCFLEICRDEGQTMTDVATRLKMQPSHASRNIRILAGVDTRSTVERAALVDFRYVRNAKTIVLTNAGIKLKEELKELIK